MLTTRLDFMVCSNHDIHPRLLFVMASVSACPLTFAPVSVERWPSQKSLASGSKRKPENDDILVSSSRWYAQRAPTSGAPNRGGCDLVALTAGGSACTVSWYRGKELSIETRKRRAREKRAAGCHSGRWLHAGRIEPAFQGHGVPPRVKSLWQSESLARR
jgi:hypothetical protein